MSIIKKVLANVVQSLLPAEQLQARSNIGITPQTTNVGSMVANSVYWSDKASGEEWKDIKNPGIAQTLYVYGDKPTIVSVQLMGWAFSSNASLTGNNAGVTVRLIDGLNIFDSVYIEIPINPSNGPGIQVPYNVVFMNAAPKNGRYKVQASCYELLSSTDFVYLSGTSVGAVHSMSCL